MTAILCNLFHERHGIQQPPPNNSSLHFVCISTTGLGELPIDHQIRKTHPSIFPLWFVFLVLSWSFSSSFFSMSCQLSGHITKSFPLKEEFYPAAEEALINNTYNKPGNHTGSKCRSALQRRPSQHLQVQRKKRKKKLLYSTCCCNIDIYCKTFNTSIPLLTFGSGTNALPTHCTEP